MAFQVALSRALARESRDSREGENSVSAKLIPPCLSASLCLWRSIKLPLSRQIIVLSSSLSRKIISRERKKRGIRMHVFDVQALHVSR